ncbi:DnaK suppressor protein [Microbacterium nanhaiense]|uniref:DnaK suppressor protein n=1 Tax=Microbacterium nanhaiense TaxID=1301026 RepID=A0ABQ2MZC5_9MICO|nr:TraR/DksA family transcriptional regulator [Microbacterium nanhaiense]GGO61017.1 DnaK suppressor protein [Microbacterium nanhaiense]
MDDRHREEFRRILEARLEDVLAARRRRSEDLTELADARSAATADDEHDPEGATLSDEWSRIVGLDAEAERELRAIDDAQKRLAEGRFGTCEACGSPIPVARLRIRPTATMCVNCASRS